MTLVVFLCFFSFVSDLRKPANLFLLRVARKDKTATWDEIQGQASRLQVHKERTM
jgi:hypothetical protein